MPACGEQCVVPVGVVFKETLEDNPVIAQILKYTSMREGEATIVPAGETIDLSQVCLRRGGYRAAPPRTADGVASPLRTGSGAPLFWRGGGHVSAGLGASHP
jgi:hypothetical protein